MVEHNELAQGDQIEDGARLRRRPAKVGESKDDGGRI